MNIRQQPTRQRVRKGLIIGLFLFFPIIMNYFSPYVIIDGASQGIINGSLVVFGLLFAVSPFMGRLTHHLLDGALCHRRPKLRNMDAWPSLWLVASPAAMEHNECILCGTCVDHCAQYAIRYSFSAGR